MSGDYFEQTLRDKERVFCHPYRDNERTRHYFSTNLEELPTIFLEKLMQIVLKDKALLIEQSPRHSSDTQCTALTPYNPLIMSGPTIILFRWTPSTCEGTVNHSVNHGVRTSFSWTSRGLFKSHFPIIHLTLHFLFKFFRVIHLYRGYCQGAN